MKTVVSSIKRVGHLIKQTSPFLADPMRLVNLGQLQSRKVIIVSFPKSGRTWLRKILLDLKVSAYFTHAYSDAIILKRAPTEPNPGAFFDRSVLFILRDPRDVVVSYFHDLTKRYRAFDGDISQMLRDPHVGVGAVARFNMAWMAQRGRFRDFHALRYEAMQKNDVETVTEILCFFGITWIGAARIRRVCEASSFDKMRKAEESGELAKAYSNKWFATAVQSKEFRKVRRGRVGGFTNEISADDVAYCNQTLRALGYPADWLGAPLD